MTDLATEHREPTFPSEPTCIGCGKAWLLDGVTFHNDLSNIYLCDHCRGPNGKEISLLVLQSHGYQTVAIKPCFNCGEPAGHVFVEWSGRCVGHIFHCASHDPHSSFTA